MQKRLLYLTFFLLFFYCAPKKTVKEITPVQKIPDKDLIWLWSYKTLINIRTGANAASAKTGRLNDGDSVRVHENVNGWYRISDPSGKKGYIRSDLLVPKAYSVFPRAVIFIDSIKNTRHVDIYFDTQKQHKKIYISYPSEIYVSEKRVLQETRQLVKQYQESVYAGTVTAMVLKPNSKDIYNKYEFAGFSNADILLPVLPFGILQHIIRKLPNYITLVIKIPEGINDQRLLSAARSMANIYPLPFTHVEFRFLDSNGLCRFWFQEDESGEHYQYNSYP